MPQVKASTQYKDLTGTSAMDFHGSLGELKDFAEEIGFDLNNYDPVGLKLYFGESNDFFSLRILGKHKEEGTIHSWPVKMDFKTFRKKFKRFEISLINQQSNISSDNEIIEERHLKD